MAASRLSWNWSSLDVISFLAVSCMKEMGSSACTVTFRFSDSFCGQRKTSGYYQTGRCGLVTKGENRDKTNLMDRTWGWGDTLAVGVTVFTFCDSFSSSSLTVSMCDRDLRHSLLKMSFMSGEHSDRTFRHSEMRSTSSSVIGFLGREDLPRCSTVTMMSMASATKD